MLQAGQRKGERAVKQVVALCWRPAAAPIAGALEGGGSSALAASALPTADISRAENCSRVAHGGT